MGYCRKCKYEKFCSSKLYYGVMYKVKCLINNHNKFEKRDDTMFEPCCTCKNESYCSSGVHDEFAKSFCDSCLADSYRHREEREQKKQAPKKPSTDAVLKDSGNRRKFCTGAVRDIQEGKGRFDLLPWDAIQDLAIHCERGAVKYGERNCEKGIPVSSLTDSAFRHLSKYVLGNDDEDHLIAAIWNLCMVRYMEKNRPEMQNIPSRKK